MSPFRAGPPMESTDGKTNARRRQERPTYLNSTRRSWFPVGIVPSRIRKPFLHRQSASQKKSSLEKTVRAHEKAYAMSGSHHSPLRDQRNRPELPRGASHASSSSSIQTNSTPSSSHGGRSTALTTPEYRRCTGYFSGPKTSGSPTTQSSRLQLPSLITSPTNEPPHLTHHRITPSSGLPPKSAQTQFYSWENLPPKDLLIRCFSAFHNPHGLAHILCPFPEAEAGAMLQQVLAAASKGAGSGAGQRHPLPSSTNSQLCQVLLVAAVGSHYLSDEHRIEREVSDALFNSGKWYLDVMFGRDAEDSHKFRANVLAALYSVFSKSIGSKEHLNRALAIGQSMGLHRLAALREKKVTGRPPCQSTVMRTPSQASHGPGQRRSHEDDDIWRKAWQALLFFDGWLSASVGVKSGGSIVGSEEATFNTTSYGYQPQLHHPPFPQSQPSIYSTPASVPHATPAYTSLAASPSPSIYPSFSPGTPHYDEQIADEIGHTAPDMYDRLAVLGALMAGITREVIGPEDSVHLNTIRTFSDRLKAWYANVPAELRLPSITQGDGNPANRTTILLIHCAYLGSIILLTRRTCVETIERTNLLEGPYTSSASSEEKEAETFSTMCVSTAKQLASVVEILRAEDRLTRRCWLVIQSAFTAGIIISLDVASRRGRPTFESFFKESMSHIDRCISVLNHCGTYDVVADHYVKILQPIYDTLSKPPRRNHYSDAYSPDNSRTPTNEQLLGYIMELLKRPYGGEHTIMEFDMFGVQQHSLPPNYRFVTDLGFPGTPGGGYGIRGAQPAMDATTVTASTTIHRAVIMPDYNTTPGEMADRRVATWMRGDGHGQYSPPN